MTFKCIISHFEVIFYKPSNVLKQLPVSAHVLEHTVLQIINPITCVVNREESLLHEKMLQVLIIHRDFSHHVAWHITSETPRLAVIETVRVFVPNHLINAEAVRSVTSPWAF